MQIEQHNLDSLRKLVRDLQEENETLKSLLKENHISYEDRNVLEEQPLSDEYDEDQGSRILPLNPDEVMARLFLSYFKGRTDVFARRGKKGGYFPESLQHSSVSI